MESRDHVDEASRRRECLGLVALVLGLALGAVALYALAGPPHLPAELPGWDAVAFTLRGSYLPLDGLGYLLTTAAWIIWFWIVGSILLRLFMVGAEVVAKGSAWVGSLRTLSDLVTPPMVRRLVDGVVVALLVVNVAGRTVPGVSAAGLSPTPTVTVTGAYQEAAPAACNVVSVGVQEQRAVEYTVRPGDSLWSIAERFYGTGHEYPRIVAANVGRTMPDGHRFTQAGVIQSGWSLLVPAAKNSVEELPGRTFYEVQQGDTLRGIAARILGDESRWSEIFDLNRDVARMDDGRTLRDPGLIWPGLRLEMPSLVAKNPESIEPSAEIPVAPSQGESDGVEPAPTVDASPVPTPVAQDEPAGSAQAGQPDEAPVVIEPEQANTSGQPIPISQGIAGMVGFMGVGGVFLLARRRVRRSLDELPIRAAVEDDLGRGSGFSEAKFARVLTHRLQGDEVEPVALVAEQTLRFLREQGMGEVSVVMARQGFSGTTLTMSARLIDQQRLMELAGKVGARLGGTGRASITSDQDVEVRFSGLRLAQLAASTNGLAESPRLLALGTLARGQMLYSNWRELGHVLLAGLPGAGVDVVLTTVIGALAASLRPEELQMWSVGTRRTLPEQFLGLPHQQMGFVDPSDEEGISRLLQGLRGELVRRLQSAECGESRPELEPKKPDIVLVIGELADLRDNGTTMEMVGVHGPAHGIHLLAATAQPGAIGDDVLTHFGTRLVLQTLNEEESIRLLGCPEAANLGSGDLFLRLEGRRPMRARGLRVPAERLEELVRLMRDARGCQDPGPDIEALAPHETMDGPTADWSTGDAWLVHAEAQAGEEAGLPAAATEAVEERQRDRVGVTTDPRPEGCSARDIEAIPTEEMMPGEVADTGEPLSHASSPVEAVDPEKVDRTNLCSAVAALPEPGDSATGDDSHANGHRAEAIPADYLVPPGEVPPAGDVRHERISLLQIRCFGGFSVTSGDQEISPSSEEGSSFKAWEVLAFLSAQPDGAVPKGKLLEALWPEVDEERAANRMRVAMARLRTLLARQVSDLTPDVVRCERDGTCRLDTRLVASDVHRFVTLCRSASKLPSEEAKIALYQARDLYGGDLLLGQGAGSYGWADERSENGLSLREAYREEYNRASQRLARLLCREQRYAEAVPLYKSLLKAEPTLEDVVRELYRCYQQTGDLSSLIREDRHLRQALRDAYYDPDDPEDNPNDYQPEPETVELFGRIRAELEGKLQPTPAVSQRTGTRSA